MTHAFAGLPVSDYDAAVAWYEELLGKPPGGMPTAVITDPDGNRLTVFADPSA